MNININRRKTHAPTLKLSSSDLNTRDSRFLVDTGSEFNIIKINNIKNLNLIDSSQIYGLSGIGDELIQTLGAITINFDNFKCRMHVVNDTFPIPWEGIFGIQFLKQHKTTLSFSDQTLTIPGIEGEIPFVEHSIVRLPARSKVLICLKVANPSTKTGYIPQIPAGPDIYLGECLATNVDGECKIYAYNCTMNDVNLNIPPVTLEE